LFILKLHHELTPLKLFGYTPNDVYFIESYICFVVPDVK